MATDVSTMKEVLGIYHPGSTHMVGDGFHVRNLFPSNDVGERISPSICELTQEGRQVLPHLGQIAETLIVGQIDVDDLAQASATSSSAFRSAVQCGSGGSGQTSVIALAASTTRAGRAPSYCATAKSRTAARKAVRASNTD